MAKVSRPARFMGRGFHAGGEKGSKHASVALDCQRPMCPGLKSEPWSIRVGSGQGDEASIPASPGPAWVAFGARCRHHADPYVLSGATHHVLSGATHRVSPQ